MRVIGRFLLWAELCITQVLVVRRFYILFVKINLLDINDCLLVKFRYLFMYLDYIPSYHGCHD